MNAGPIYCGDVTMMVNSKTPPSLPSPDGSLGSPSSRVCSLSSRQERAANPPIGGLLIGHGELDLVFAPQGRKIATHNFGIREM
jgi:hypothetical protein